MAILWALGCLLCAASNDFLFKLFKQKASATGIFTALIGVVWLGIMLPGLSTFSGSLPESFLWGSLSGILSISANLLLITSMKYQSAGVSSTIYRLNLAAVTLGAWILFDESLNRIQILGIVTALIAILFFFPWNEKENRGSRIGLFLALAAALLRAGMALSYKQGLLNGSTGSGIIFWNSICWIIGGILWYLAAERHLNPVSGKLAGYGVCSGVLVFGITFTMTQALMAGKANLVIPIAQMSFIITFLLGGIILRERFDLLKIAGAVLGTGGVLLLSCG